MTLSGVCAHFVQAHQPLTTLNDTTTYLSCNTLADLYELQLSCLLCDLFRLLCPIQVSICPLSLFITHCRGISVSLVHGLSEL